MDVEYIGSSFGSGNLGGLGSEAVRNLAEAPEQFRESEA